MTNKPVIFHPEARLELEDASSFYESRRIGKGNEFKREILDASTRIQRFPANAPARGRLRFLTFNRFPYSIVYRELERLVLIIAIAHASRKPGYWRERLKENDLHAE